MNIHNHLPTRQSARSVMYNVRMYMRTVAIAVVSFILGTISIGVAYAWNGPTAAPPGDNVAAPLNVSTNDQQKLGWVGLDSLSIFKHMIITGSRGADPTVRYLNFGTVWDASGYGIRDNDGTLEFKNSGGSWDSIQTIVFNLAGGSSAWTANGNNIYNNNTGNVGIGTNSPISRLTVVGAANFIGNSTTATNGISSTYRLSDNTMIGYVGDGSSANNAMYVSSYLSDGLTMSAYNGGDVRIGTEPGSVTTISMPKLTVKNSGNVGIGTASPGSKLDVAGGVNASAGYTQNSDARLKDNIQPLDSAAGLVVIGKLQPVSFDWRDSEMGSNRQYGFIAQDVQRILPLLVATSSATNTLTPDGTLTLNYIGLIPYIVESIKELAVKVNETAHLLKTDRVQAKELCAQKTDGTQVCVTGDQLAALLAK